MAGDLTAYIDYDIQQANRAMNELERRNRRTTSTIEREWDQAGTKIAKMFGPGNLLRAAFAGIGASIGIAVAGFREYAKYSDEAAAAMDRMAQSRSRLLREIGADVFEATQAAGWDDPYKPVRNTRDRLGVVGAWLTTPSIAPADGVPNPSLTEQMRNIDSYRNAENDALMRRQYIDRAARAQGAIYAATTGDTFAPRVAAEMDELRRIALERSAISNQDTLASEKRRALMLEEMAAAERLNNIERERREEAERRAEAEKKAADAIEKEQLARMMTTERAKDMYAFQERDLRLELARAAGLDGVDAEEINLRFDRLKYGLASDTSLSPEERDVRRARLDEIRSQRLALLGVQDPEARAASRRFLPAGTVNSGFAGVTSILRQAFTPQGAPGQNVEVQQLKELQQIRRSVQNGSVARLG